MAQIEGTSGDDSLVGTTGEDFMSGYGGNDTIIGGNGSDLIHGGLGNDSLVGGDDINWDTVSYETWEGGGTTGAVLVNLQNGTASGADGLDVLIGFERVDGSAFNDTIIGSTRNEDFDGRAGNDSIVGGGGFDKVFYLRTNGANGVNVNLGTGLAQDGLGGTDTLSGISQIVSSLYNDTLTGNSADNTFTPFSGSDSITGGDGFDQVDYSFSASAINAHLGTGRVTGKSYVQNATTLGGADTLVGIEMVKGSNFNDTLVGS